VRTALGRYGRARPLGGKAYFGNTTQRLPMVLRVSPDGRTVDQQALMWNAKCKDNVAGLGRATSSPAMRIRPDGSFAQTKKRADSCDSGPMRWAVRI
jgi:hypothetical protein